MFSGFEAPTRQLLSGNILLILCCIFYLLWWIIAFKPEGGIKGMRSGWLLIPAFIFGIAAIIQIVRGSSGEGTQEVLIPKAAILLVGLAAYVILLVVTWIAMKRPVTTELLLIVGWTVLTFLELNALYALGRFGKSGTIVFLVLVAAAAAVGLICYLLYYGLDSRTGYIDGMIPLLLVVGMQTAVSVGIVN